ncbi:hypothetical protein SAMN06265370_12412 [Puniceibacterium sediminis]|uniref:Uncharacterized protein n=1 Tax=Puniceibacterium sediminis TaxID=1608407 RepID=A0A238Z5F2_9RHOB|nr:hypothetical protein SAMN06265370_12412 [Puniceibacterium sediminis]
MPRSGLVHPPFVSAAAAAPKRIIATRDHIHARAKITESPQDRLIGSRLRGVADQMRHPLQRIVEEPETAGQRGGRVDVKGRYPPWPRSRPGGRPRRAGCRSCRGNDPARASVAPGSGSHSKATGRVSQSVRKSWYSWESSRQDGGRRTPRSNARKAADSAVFHCCLSAGVSAASCETSQTRRAQRAPAVETPEGEQPTAGWLRSGLESILQLEERYRCS